MEVRKRGRENIFSLPRFCVLGCILAGDADIYSGPLRTVLDFRPHSRLISSEANYYDEVLAVGFTDEPAGSGI
jgi:hypothetical protein